MAELERDIQKRFLDNLLDQKDGFESSAISTYQMLVFQRYDEVIRNSLPLFVKSVDEKTFENSIKAFMKETPSTPFLWKIPKDYIKFVKKAKLFDSKKYLYELMYFDWVEIEIYMKEYKLSKLKKFDFKNTYKLNKSARIKAFKYDIINQNIKKKRDNFVLVYYDFDVDEVIYRETNQMIFELLKRLERDTSIEKVLKKLCKENDIIYKEAKKVLKDSLVELHNKRVFS